MRGWWIDEKPLTESQHRLNQALHRLGAGWFTLVEVCRSAGFAVPASRNIKAHARDLCGRGIWERKRIHTPGRAGAVPYGYRIADPEAIVLSGDAAAKTIDGYAAVVERLWEWCDRHDRSFRREMIAAIERHMKESN
ncbi:MAG: hypothetical protein ACPGVG_14915 [Mycobacterium sp.]